jgi:hypothetical protein
MSHASNRLHLLAPVCPGDEGTIIVHQWLGAAFDHVLDGSRPCPCNPWRIPADDPRSLDEIVDDIEEHDRSRKPS